MSDDLSQLMLFKNLSSCEMEQVKGAAIERQFLKGAAVIIEGQESDGLYIVISGLIKVIKIHGDGQEKTLDLIGEGDVLGEMTIVGSNVRSATALVVKPAKVIVFPGKSFQKLMADIPQLAINIIEILSNRLRKANAHIEALSFMNSHNRVLFNLIQMAGEIGKAGEGKAAIAPRLSQSEMANLCGVSRQIVNKVFSELRRSGLIEIDQQHIRILDMDGLCKLLYTQ